VTNGAIGFGLVGTGMAGGFHAKELRHVRGGRLVAACSREPSRLQAFAREWEVPRTYTHFSELCRDPAVDVVCVLTPTGTHLEVARAAVAAGKHLLVEKPLDVNLARADEMIRLCRTHRIKLGVIFQMRFGTVAARLKEAVQSGALGRVFLADAVDKSSRTPAYYNSAEWRGTKALEGGGCLMTQSIHIVDLLQYVVGPVRSVIGRVATTQHAIEVEDTATALVSFESGAMGVIESTSSIKPALKSRLELHGDHGTIVANAQTRSCSGTWAGRPYPRWRRTSPSATPTTPGRIPRCVTASSSRTWSTPSARIATPSSPGRTHGCPWPSTWPSTSHRARARKSS